MVIELSFQQSLVTKQFLALCAYFSPSLEDPLRVKLQKEIGRVWVMGGQEVQSFIYHSLLLLFFFFIFFLFSFVSFNFLFILSLIVYITFFNCRITHIQESFASHGDQPIEKEIISIPRVDINTAHFFLCSLLRRLKSKTIILVLGVW